MRRRTGLACIIVGALAGVGAGLGLSVALPGALVGGGSGNSPTAPATTAATTAASTASPTPGSAPLGIGDLLRPVDLARAGWDRQPIEASTSSVRPVPVISPCQLSGPFDGLDAVFAGRWTSSGRRADELIAQAGSVDDARSRADRLYRQQVGCAELPNRTVGTRHAVTVDGGSITWFAVSEDSRDGYSSVLRQGDRFALVYVDAENVSAADLPGLLTTAAEQLR